MVFEYALWHYLADPAGLVRLQCSGVTPYALTALWRLTGPEVRTNGAVRANMPRPNKQKGKVFISIFNLVLNNRSMGMQVSRWVTSGSVLILNPLRGFAMRLFVHSVRNTSLYMCRSNIAAQNHSLPVYPAVACYWRLAGGRTTSPNKVRRWWCICLLDMLLSVISGCGLGDSFLLIHRKRSKRAQR